MKQNNSSYNESKATMTISPITPSRKRRSILNDNDDDALSPSFFLEEAILNRDCIIQPPKRIQSLDISSDDDDYNDFDNDDAIEDKATLYGIPPSLSNVSLPSRRTNHGTYNAAAGCRRLRDPMNRKSSGCSSSRPCMERSTGTCVSLLTGDTPILRPYRQLSSRALFQFNMDELELPSGDECEDDDIIVSVHPRVKRGKEEGRGCHSPKVIFKFGAISN